ncbi:hypothetical protein ACFL31_02000 [Candidatus Margulisiibacteriota bacterium]
MIIFIIICFLTLPVTAWAETAFVDPELAPRSKLVYQVEESKQQFEHHIYVDQINAKEGQAYSIISDTSLGTLETSRTKSVYAKSPFLPLSHIESYNNTTDNFYYYKVVHWNWQTKQSDFEEIYQDGEKNERNEFSTSWQDQPAYDVSLMYTGLLNGLPISADSRQTDLKLSVGNFAVAVDFQMVTTEVVSAAGRNWECYKIEATPNLGALLNWVKFFFGNPKSYFWLTTAMPKLIIRADVKTPWYERKAELKSFGTY